MTGLGGSLALALSMGSSLSALTATITNTTNTAATAAMAIKETSGAATCNSYDATTTCSGINKYGGTASPLLPGGSQTVTVNFENTGSVAATSGTLAPATCVATSTGATGSSTPSTPNTTPGNLCSVLQVKVYKAASATGATSYDGALSGFTSSVALGALAAGANQSWTFVVSLPGSATTAVQGQQVSQQLAWTYNQ